MRWLWVLLLVGCVDSAGQLETQLEPCERSGLVLVALEAGVFTATIGDLEVTLEGSATVHLPPGSYTVFWSGLGMSPAEGLEVDVWAEDYAPVMFP